MGLLTAQERKPPQNEADRDAAYRSMLAYSGRYRVDSGKLITKVDVVWNEAWVGTEQARDYKIEGTKLHVVSPPAPNPSFGGRTTRVSSHSSAKAGSTGTIMTSDTAPARPAGQHGGRPQRELRLAAVTPQPPDARIEMKPAESELPIRGDLAPASGFPGTSPGLASRQRRDLSHAVDLCAIGWRRCGAIPAMSLRAVSR